MKKGCLDIHIHLSNRWLYTFIAIGILVIMGVGVYAYGGGLGAPSVFGHTINETAPPSPCATDNFLKWDGTKWVCGTPAVSSQWIISGSDIYYNTGKVGIGTINPAALLQVNKSGTSDQEVARFSAPNGNAYITIGNGITATTGGYIAWEDTDDRLRIGIHGTEAPLQIRSGKVGIGTTIPGAKLEVNGSIKWNSGTSENSRFVTQGTSASVGGDYGLEFYVPAYDSTSNWGTRLWKDHHNGGISLKISTQQASTWYNNVVFGWGGQVADPLFGVYGGAVIGSGYTESYLPPTNGLIVQGNVGIATTSPTDKLNVVGNTNITGNLIVGGNLNVSGETHFLQGYCYDTLSGGCNNQYGGVTSPAVCGGCNRGNDQCCCKTGYRLVQIGSYGGFIYFSCIKS